MGALYPGARVLHDRFRLLALLGEGGMGVVWEAEEIATTRRRAIKFVKNDTSSHAVEKRFLREAQAANAVRHPSILHIDEVTFDADGTPAFVMDLLEGESLATRLERDMPLTVGQTAAILRHVASALRAAHASNVVHRDLKPDNVFICQAHDGSVEVRVLDFGIARKLDLPSETLTLTGTLLGTPLYMSPEQAGGEKDLDARTDIWSIAVIAFECITGSTPVVADNFGQLLTKLIRGEYTRLSQMQVDIPADLCAAIDQSLVERTRRPADLGVLQTVLERYADPHIAPPSRAPSHVLSVPAGPVVSRDAETIGQTMMGGGIGGRPRRPPMMMTGRHAAAASVDPNALKRFVAPLAAVFALLTVVGVVMGTIAMRARARQVPMAASSPLPATAVDAGIEVVPSASVAVPSTMPSATVPEVATTHPKAAHGGRGVPAARATTAPKGSGPVRLQGGVAGDVPF